MASQFAAQGVGQRAHRKFAHRIGGDARQGDVPGDAADNDHTAATRAHVAERRLDSTQHTKHIGVELTLIVSQRQLLEAAGHRKAGIGNDNVDAEACGMCLIDDPLGITRPRDITATGQRLTTGDANFGCQGFKPLEPARRKHHHCTLRRKFARQRGANTGGSPGNQYRATRESWAVQCAPALRPPYSSSGASTARTVAGLVWICDMTCPRCRNGALLHFPIWGDF